MVIPDTTDVCILDTITQVTVNKCWQHYLNLKRMPTVAEVLKEVLESQNLSLISDQKFQAMVYSVTQLFQNLLLQERTALTKNESKSHGVQE